MQSEAFRSEKRKRNMENTYHCYANRELSWLRFNERVLEEAEDSRLPLCERLSFLSIFQSNLDEFFMVRIGSLQDQMLLDKNARENKTNMTSGEQIDAALAFIHKLTARRDAAYNGLLEQLAEQGIRLLDFAHMEEESRTELEKLFRQDYLPLLSSFIISKKQAFPFLKNKGIYAVAVLSTKAEKKKIGIVPCGNEIFPRLVPVPGRTGCFILSEELILHFLSKVFSGYKILSKSLMRVTRNADIDADALYDEDLDYREFMVELIKKRKKLAPVRIELSRKLSEGSVKLICEHLAIKSQYVFHSQAPLDLSFVFQIEDALRKIPELFYERRTPRKSPAFTGDRPILDQIKEKDKLLSYPYESINPFLNMLHEAANDKDVVSIKMTLYRVAKQSKVVEALIEAAENGKEVLVLVELKARFDEENNIGWSRLLEDAGCRVIYGLDGYKVHSKLCLITKKTDEQIEYYTQIGTGNYNEKTSRLYTDLSLMTYNVDIGLEAANVFQALAMGETIKHVDHLLVAPKCLQNKILDMIDEEIAHARAGEPAYIGLKMNSLTDKKIMEKLVEASCAGVRIDMVIRGICCLIPQVPGKTENIHVRSIVGRFLEHSRIYIFGSEGREKIYIASADFMTRNTLRRVEVAAPVYDEEIKARLLEMFRIMLKDNQQARQENGEGIYRILPTDEEPLNAQEYFYEQAYEIAENL